MSTRKHRRALFWSLLVGSAVAVAPSLGDPGATATGIVGEAGAQASPLSADEEAHPLAAELARHFNPAMALPDHDGPWPVAMSYAWVDGADLMSRTLDDGGAVVARAVATPNQALREGRSWGDLPARDHQGRRLEYYIDAPGDDGLKTGDGDGDRSGWRQRWRELAGDDPARSRFPPTQYAHLFWLDRARGLLVIQYWFYFPFNEWINHHEGDWEHVNLVLEGSSSFAPPATFRVVGHQFFFHGKRFEPARTVRVASGAASAAGDGADGARDHVVVFTGGRGRFLWWGGTQSGASYPWPARYRGAGGSLGPFAIDDDTRQPGRFLGPASFQVVLLPEPARLDTRAHPELSWLKLRFFAGQDHMLVNPPLLDWRGGGSPPLQPGVRRDWNSTTSHPRWSGEVTLAQAPETQPPREGHTAR